MIEKGLIKNPKPLPPINPDEVPYKLPEGWEWCRLGELGDFGSGATPTRDNPDYYGGEITWFKSGELTSDYISTSQECITEKALKKFSLRLNVPGDILIAMYGATIGKSAITTVHATTNQAVCGCTPFKGLQNTFLLLFYRAWLPRFIAQGSGGAQPNISKDKIIRTVFPLPPLAEQQRIVKRVNELMKLVDKLEEKQTTKRTLRISVGKVALRDLTEADSPIAFQHAWERLEGNFEALFSRDRENIKALRRTVLSLAVRGKLVSQNPNDEPASELLKKIATEKKRMVKEGLIKKSKPLPPINPDEVPYKLPEGWEWCRLGRISQQIKYGFTASADETISAPKFLRITDIQNGKVHWSAVPGCKIRESELLKYICSEGDILIARTGGTIGKSYLFPAVDFQCVFASYLIRVIPFIKDLSRYLIRFLESPPYWVQLYGSSMGTGQPNVNGTALSNLHIPLPPLAEQLRIMERVDSLMEIIDQLERGIEQGKRVAEQYAGAVVGGIS